jgi:hypothetical protein
MGKCYDPSHDELPSEVERLREALLVIANYAVSEKDRNLARAALDREGEGEQLRQLGVPYADDLDREGEDAR